MDHTRAYKGSKSGTSFAIGKEKRQANLNFVDFIQFLLVANSHIVPTLLSHGGAESRLQSRLQLS